MNINSDDLQDKDAEKIFWNGESQSKHYESYEKKVYSAFKVPEYIEMIQLVNGNYLLLRNASILDIGCSAGVSTITLATLDFKVTGIDISDGLITQAKQLAANEKINTEFFTGDATRLPFENQSFDVCFMVGLLHHFPNYLPVIEDIYRVLKPGGLIVAVEPNAWNLSYMISFKLVYLKQGVTPNEFPISPFKIRDDFSKLFSRVSILPFRRFDVPFLRQSGWIGKGLMGQILRRGCLIFRWLLMPKMIQGTFFIAVGKKE